MVSPNSDLWDAGVARAIALLSDRAANRRPGGWDLAHRANDGEGWVHLTSGMTAIWSVAREQDGRLWVHASMAHPKRVPYWDDLKRLREWLFPLDRYVYQVLPPLDRYVNVNPNVLHLWAVVDGPEPLPDFLRGGTSL